METQFMNESIHFGHVMGKLAADDAALGKSFAQSPGTSMIGAAKPRPPFVPGRAMPRAMAARKQLSAEQSMGLGTAKPVPPGMTSSPATTKAGPYSSTPRPAPPPSTPPPSVPYTLPNTGAPQAPGLMGRITNPIKNTASTLGDWAGNVGDWLKSRY
jgi:hypothetical protein